MIPIRNDHSEWGKMNRTVESSISAFGAEKPFAADSNLPSRRDLVHQGARLVFVAPFLTTFFAGEARAAASHHSCYPQGGTCPATEPCCSGLCLAMMCT
jgi:hypothetical protein